MNRLTAEQKAMLLPIIEQDWETLNVILPTEMLIKRAANLADQFELRGYDSVHLAAAEAISLQIMPQPLIFACFDKQLNEAVKALGMRVL
jgi:predicted nucleic acid-binding protein